MISLMQVVDGFINVPYPTAVAAHIPTDSSIFIKCGGQWTGHRLPYDSEYDDECCLFC